jgi:hypothetical protein
MNSNVFIDYKLLKIGFRDLKKFYENPYKSSSSNAIVVSKDDIVNAIRLYETNAIDMTELVCWAAVMQLSELYTYPDDAIEQEQVATAMDMIVNIRLFDICLDDIYLSKIKNILKM